MFGHFVSTPDFWRHKSCSFAFDGFGDRVPIEGWETEDGVAWALMTRHTDTGSLGIIVMRRREDGVWANTYDQVDLQNLETARERARVEMRLRRKYRRQSPRAS